MNGRVPRCGILAALLALPPGFHGNALQAGEQGTGSLNFATDILPVLTKAGCNSGACHGAALGQGGFKLSLLGYDPEEDFTAITRERGGRRINLTVPEASLFLRKPTRAIRHKGGRKIEPGSADHHLLVQWIRAGVPAGDASVEVTRLTVEPAEQLGSVGGSAIPLRVWAQLSTGARREATAHALFSSNDDSVAEVDAAGRVSVVGRGLTSIMVRFAGKVTAARVGAPFAVGNDPAAGFAPRGFVDRAALVEWRKLGLTPSPGCDDGTFLRRAHLDLAGRLPTGSEAREWLALSSPRPRADVIARLLAGDDFVDFWTLKFADWLLLDSKKLGPEALRAYHGWLRGQIAGNTPMHRLAIQLVSAQGDFLGNPPANFHRTERDPRDFAEFVSRSLFGIRVACARCHAHPFAAWTQEDYHSFAAYFARTGVNEAGVFQKARGEVEHPKTKRIAMPFPLVTPGASRHAGALPEEANRLDGLAGWMATAPENNFARAFVNRVWRELMGRGLVEPVDDFRPSNPASLPALLEELTARFVSHGHDLRWLVGEIANSATYQLSSRAHGDNAADHRFFSRAHLKPLGAQVLADAIAQVTGVPDVFEGHDTGTRAVQLADARLPSYTLEVFGRCARETACDTAEQSGGGLTQVLHLMNGAALNDKLRGGFVRELLQAKVPPALAVERMFLRALGRLPTAKEAEHFAARLAHDGGLSPTGVEDLLWALLNSREFGFNH